MPKRPSALRRPLAQEVIRRVEALGGRARATKRGRVALYIPGAKKVVLVAFDGRGRGSHKLPNALAELARAGGIEVRPGRDVRGAASRRSTRTR